MLGGRLGKRLVLHQRFWSHNDLGDSEMNATSPQAFVSEPKGRFRGWQMFGLRFSGA